MENQMIEEEKYCYVCGKELISVPRDEYNPYTGERATNRVCPIEKCGHKGRHHGDGFYSGKGCVLCGEKRPGGEYKPEPYFTKAEIALIVTVILITTILLLASPVIVENALDILSS